MDSGLVVLSARYAALMSPEAALSCTVIPTMSATFSSARPRRAQRRRPEVAGRHAFALPLATLLGPVAISQVHERDFRPESLDESDAVIRILTNLITKSIAE